MNIIQVGYGKWGKRVYKALHELGHRPRTTVDAIDQPLTRMGDGPTSQTLPSIESLAAYDGMIIATPVTHRMEFIEAAVVAGIKRLRIEKPMALSATHARTIAEYCERHGVELTVGFTLLHHPAYEALVDLVGETDTVVGIRIGPEPAPGVCPLLDLGIHTASIAAALNATTLDITAKWVRGVDARFTGAGPYIVDELRDVIYSDTIPADLLRVRQIDALTADLAAWIDGSHRGTPELGIRAHELLEGTEQWAKRSAATFAPDTRTTILLPE